MVCGGKQNKVDEDEKLYTEKFKKTKKLLLLGTGESGKTTIIKQMKLLHINGFSEQERKEKIPYIKQNIHESIYDILNNMEKLNPPVHVSSGESLKSVEYILSLGPETPHEHTEEYYHHVKVAWADAGVQESFRRSNEYQLIDSAEHFLNRLDEIKKEDYVPSTQDILFFRVMTVSISKIEFEVPVPKKYGGGMAEFWMYDVGGQRGQRKKWIQVFDGIQAILFLIAASDFDQTLREDESKNRLEESFSLFRDIHSSRFVRDAGLIVFLNKQDLLLRKIKEGHRLDKYFPEFVNFKLKSDKNLDEYENAKLFMEKKILDIADTPLNIEHIGYVPGVNIHEELPPRKVYIHHTIAVDTENIKKVFKSVQDMIMEKIVTDTFY